MYVVGEWKNKRERKEDRDAVSYTPGRMWEKALAGLPLQGWFYFCLVALVRKPLWMYTSLVLSHLLLVSPVI